MPKVTYNSKLNDLTFIAFEGYDLIATVAEEIREPEKNIPRATFISLGITMIMYLLILFVSLAAVAPPDGQPSWQFLGAFGETAIVRAAEGFMPAFGVAVIVFGGLLSTMSALNATVMASSRVAFSMGRDRLLPLSMAKIHPERRTPHIAIMVTGVVLLAMALTLPIEAVGSAASLIFLLTFAMVNLSVITLRRKAPHLQRHYKVPFKLLTKKLEEGGVEEGVEPLHLEYLEEYCDHFDLRQHIHFGADVVRVRRRRDELRCGILFSENIFQKTKKLKKLSRNINFPDFGTFVRRSGSRGWHF